MTVVTRFAPSPTGFLHIGGARTALFNWLFARHHGGVFRLRIEDTDRQRSTKEAIDAIIDGLKWLGLDWDDETVFQFARAPRHAQVALEMLKQGKAYYCYTTPEELEQMREAARAAGKPMRYDGRWRDRDPKDAPPGVKPVIRLKAPTSGETVVHDKVQGEVRVSNEQLDDMILLRSDGNPTYMHSVVVDDHDMGITHVIRGDDHLTNTFRQLQIYQAMGWEPPSFAHIPLIHGPDGAKLSKRHGALGVEAYRDMGYLPEALRNYLLRLGWGHGDDEIISTEQAVQWFDLDGCGRAPSRFDFAKLDNLNGHYLRQADDARLVQEVALRLGVTGDATTEERLTIGMPGLKARAKTLKELADNARFYTLKRPLAPDDKARAQLTAEASKVLKELRGVVAGSQSWSGADLEAAARGFAKAKGIKLGQIAQPLRAALTGATTSPPIFEVMQVLGREETLGRIDDVLAGS
ncbi:glutamate--tRNA ligase [Dongia deserti]|uniref:glutamate--tRNA ligase n=1 Tax=Dongia deserti TaxID=2268030 RepID=UPI000E65B6B7|nr:glutamate--tRNA ligase [Dongia deserti]